MTSPETSRYVRLRVDLVLEVDDADALTDAALERIVDDEFMPEEERNHAQSAVQADAAEALAYLVDPFDLVGEVPGVELAQASWSTEPVEHDPESLEWDLDEEDGYLDDAADTPENYSRDDRDGQEALDHDPEDPLEDRRDHPQDEVDRRAREGDSGPASHGRYRA
ncbi:hypothetical protein [Streptomyces sp. NPDC006879]|uniref:hypothetical protein n=1 Tax=Streptomyces sp. NPDC006879 TaxID=3364767 RepID=UPI003695F904